MPPEASAAAAVAAEQQRIAQLIHKTVGQTITGARFLVAAMARVDPAERRSMARDWRQLDKQLAQASEELHRLIASLQPKSRPPAPDIPPPQMAVPIRRKLKP